MKKITFYPFNEFARTGLVSLCLAILCVSCGQEAGAEQLQGDVKSYLQGKITLSAEVDSIPDFSGFEILVAERTNEGPDTLGFTTTNAEGQFAMEVTAPRSNIYSLVIARAGAVLRVDEIAIAHGDSATFNINFPFGNRPIMIRSKENAALLGFKNTVALHNAEMDRLSREGVEDRAAYAMRVLQTAEILWSLKESNPEALASNLAASRAITMLEEWNDSLLVARARELDADNVNYANVVGAARRAVTRLEGIDRGPQLVNELQAKVTNEDIMVAVQSELVLAYRDVNMHEEALEAARALKMEFATDSSWIRWADRAIYDLENLRPGMAAPAFEYTDTEGNAVGLETFAGKYLVLEFYAPGPDFENQLHPRNAFFRAEEDEKYFEILSFSLQSDPVMNEAFFEGRDIPGRHVFLEEGPGARVVTDYNVYLLPTRYLIDPEGMIVGKYVLNNGLTVFQDALTLSLSGSSN